MTLQKYINQIGVKKACELFLVARSTVDQWRQLSSVPKPEKSLMIVKKTHGLVTWEGIYKPYALQRIKNR